MITSTCSIEEMSTSMANFASRPAVLLKGDIIEFFDELDVKEFNTPSGESHQVLCIACCINNGSKHFVPISKFWYDVLRMPDEIAKPLLDDRDRNDIAHATHPLDVARILAGNTYKIETIFQYEDNLPSGKRICKNIPLLKRVR